MVDDRRIKKVAKKYFLQKENKFFRMPGTIITFICMTIDNIHVLFSILAQRCLVECLAILLKDKMIFVN